MKKISVVIPCYNESSGIHILYNSLKDVFSKFDSKYDFEIVFVNDGSTDNTIDILRTFHDQDKKVKVIDLSRNFGHQLALTAGLDFASGDAVVTMDADMQDPPELILDMIKKWEDGYDIVYAQRINRDVDSSFKRVTANLFYRFLNLISYVKTPNDTADFRLIDKKVLDEIKKIREHNRYI
ncbi:MAG: glycosyltransferase family 2 protein, partial [Patescibacteria group bacterium]|nr:glycosyltransferase family 2 protein [Patescibacteria group bacterium]